MTSALVEARVSSLESMVAELVQVSMATQRNVDQLSLEMREFKDEMADFKDEMSEFKDESRRRSAEADDRLDKHIQENRLMLRDMNRKWWEIANKQGRITEDLVAPSIGRIVQELLGGTCADLDEEAVRVKRRHMVTRERREFDAMAECRDYVLINETKSALTPTDVDTFLAVMGEIRLYFPVHRQEDSRLARDALCRFQSRTVCVQQGNCRPGRGGRPHGHPERTGLCAGRILSWTQSPQDKLLT